MKYKTLEEVNATIREIEEMDEDITSKTKMMEEELKEYHGDDRVIAFKDFVVGEKKHHVPSGVGDLDAIVGGFGKGDIITIVADSGAGKSTFSRFLLKKFIEKGKRSLYFNYEETNEEFLSRFAELPEGYFPQVVNDTSMAWIEARVLESILKYKTEIVFIDNLTMLVDYGSFQNTTTQIVGIMKKLKQIALRYNVVIFLMHHIRKEDKEVIDRNSLNDSRSVVNISSVIISFRRKKAEQSKKDILAFGVKWTNQVLFSIIKNRYNGREDSFLMDFDEKKQEYTKSKSTLEQWAEEATKQTRQDW